jgi:hypothetical protein
MRIESGRFFIAGAAALVLLAAPAFAANHDALNGTWVLEAPGDTSALPAGSGTVTIWNRQHHIFISRNLDWNTAEGGVHFRFSTDAREGATIRNGNLTSKAKWDGDVLKVTTTDNTGTTVERYSLDPDGELRLEVVRPAHAPDTLFFARRR